MAVMTEPKFMLRLDVAVGAAAEPQSVHLQADCANMRRLQVELQRAIDEMQTVHCQRFSRYIT